MVTLARAGYDSALAIGLAESDVATVDDARRRGCRIVSVPGLGREVTPTRDLIALLQLVRLFRRERPAIVHTHTSKAGFIGRSEEHTSELQSLTNLVCRLLLEKKKQKTK